MNVHAGAGRGGPDGEVADCRRRRPRRGRQPADGLERPEHAVDRQGRHPAAGPIRHRGTRLPPARGGADAAHSAQLDHRHPSRSVCGWRVRRRARPVHPRPHRTGQRSRHADARLRRADPGGGARATRRDLRPRRDRRRRGDGDVPRGSAHRVAERAEAAVRVVRATVGRRRRRRAGARLGRRRRCGRDARRDRACALDRRPAGGVPRLAGRLRNRGRSGARMAGGDGGGGSSRAPGTRPSTTSASPATPSRRRSRHTMPTPSCARATRSRSACISRRSRPAFHGSP